MRYFFIKEDTKVVDAPEIINWSNKINFKNLKIGNYHKIEKRTILKLRSNKDMVFTDIISTPFFLVSKKIKEILELYEPNLNYKQIILLDQKNEMMQVYYLPMLTDFNCLTNKTVYNMDRSIIKEGFLDREMVGDTSIFTISGMEHRYIVVRLDLVESILRRGAIACFEELN